MQDACGVAGGDAHKHTITLAVLEQSGAEVTVATFGVDPEGMVKLLEWIEALPVRLERIGIEGSASWGRPATEFLVRAGFDVREVNPARTSDRRRRRRRPKTDREDALAVAREVLAEPNLPPAISASPVSEVHAEITVVCERRRSLMRRRQRALNEAEGALTKLPLNLRSRLPVRGTVLARLRGLASLDVAMEPPAVRELVSWLLEMRSDVAEWERRIGELEERLPDLLAKCGSSLTEEVGLGVVSAPSSSARSAIPSAFAAKGPSPVGAAWRRWPRRPAKAKRNRPTTALTCWATGPSTGSFMSCP
ncbi:MAG TPA: transposase [Acidimicrobiales bacterium]|nr:transposase [Acidimicrobiales bacterium]